MLILINLGFFFNTFESLIKNEYFSILIYFCIAILLSVVIVSFSFFFVNQNPENEKMSVYECGFEAYQDARHKFDIKFYLVGMLFILFDIETMFLLPWAVSVSKLTLLGFWSMIDFIFELVFGYIYICYVGALDWNV